MDENREKKERNVDLFADKSSIVLKIRGSIKSLITTRKGIYCVKYEITFGETWEVHDGFSRGITQLAENSYSEAIFNFPLELTLKSSSPLGWPKVVFSVYTKDFFGREIIYAYGTKILKSETNSTKSLLQADTFSIVASSFYIKLIGALYGQHPELVSVFFLSKSHGREKLRTSSQYDKLTFDFNICILQI